MKEALEKVLLEEIPLTRAMGLKVLEASASKVVLSAPLEPNHNHKRTAFGGSLYSLAVLSGWGLLWLRLKEAGLEGHVVIVRSEAEYLRPVVQDFQATAEADEEAVAWAVELFRRKGKARVVVATRIGPSAEPGLRFVGTYALLK